MNTRQSFSIAYKPCKWKLNRRFVQNAFQLLLQKFFRHDRMRKEIVYKGSAWKDGCNENLPELLRNLDLTRT